MKSVLITGAASGLGFDTAKFLAVKGFNVYAGMRDIESRNSEAASALSDFALNCDGSISPLELDVTNKHDITSVAEKFTSGLDCLVNNAGLGALGFIESFSLEQVRRVFEVNLFGPFALTKALLPKLAKNHGLVINVSSAGGRLCFPFLGVYNSSKFALEGLMESWNIESQNLGVDICLIEPGAYPTDLHNKRLQPSDMQVMKKYGDVAHAPEQMVAGMASAFEDKETAPSPTEISEHIYALISSDKRPIRSVIGNVGTAGIEELNNVNLIAQKNLLKFFGL